jgi:hypothetical protein
MGWMKMVGEYEDGSQESRPAESGERSGRRGNPPEPHWDRGGRGPQGQAEAGQQFPSPAFRPPPRMPGQAPPPGPRISRARGSEWFPLPGQRPPSLPPRPPAPWGAPPGPRLSHAGTRDPRRSPGPSSRGRAGMPRATGPAEDLREVWFRRLLRTLGLRRTSKV